MNRFIYLTTLTIIAASLLLTGCKSSTPAPTSLVVEQPTQTSQPPTATLLPTYTPVPTEAFTPTSPAPPTNTPLPTEAATPTQAVATATAVVAGAPTAQVNENTNCRTGPSSGYDLIATLLIGEQAKIVSKTTLEDYVIIENPADPTQTCWLWTKYVTISGDLSSLPAATPPPPLVKFTVDFMKIDSCTNYSLVFEVVNTATKPLQAYTIVAKDLSERTQQTTTSTVFDQKSGCGVVKSIEYVDPGKIGYVYANDFAYNPSGHSIEATITICSHNDMTSPCASQVIRFTP